MPKFAANLAMMFRELDFEDRFAAAASAGFRAIEYQFPYDKEPGRVKQLLDAHGMTFALINAPAGDSEKGERGFGAVPGREADFAAAIDTALAFAHTAGMPRVHAMAGCPPADAARPACRDTFIANLKANAPKAAAAGIDLLLEPINTENFPGYFLNYAADAVEIIEAVGAPNIGLQFDVYHCQMMRGRIADQFHRYQPYICYMQIAGVPGRHEPDDTCEINYPYLFDAFDRAGYDGWIGCEYNPAGETRAGLRWYEPYRAN